MGLILKELKAELYYDPQVEYVFKKEIAIL